jgi:hypothetical protein
LLISNALCNRKVIIKKAAICAIFHQKKAASGVFAIPANPHEKPQTAMDKFWNENVKCIMLVLYLKMSVPKDKHVMPRRNPEIANRFMFYPFLKIHSTKSYSISYSNRVLLLIKS